MIDRTNKNWNKEISDEDILNREFTTAYLIQTNQHLPIFQQLKDLVLSTYKVVAEFEHLGYNGHSIFANNQRLVYRLNKFGEMKTGKNVNIISNGLSKYSGSNQYPSIGFNGDKITLEFISYGLPCVDKTNGWKINIISINKIN